MSETGHRWFYIARSKQGGKICYIVSAHTLQKAMGSLGVLGNSYEFKQLRNKDMVKLLGCIKGVTELSSCFAKGDILMYVKGGYVAIRVAD